MSEPTKLSFLNLRKISNVINFLNAILKMETKTNLAALEWIAHSMDYYETIKLRIEKFVKADLKILQAHTFNAKHDELLGVINEIDSFLSEIQKNQTTPVAVQDSPESARSHSNRDRHSHGRSSVHNSHGRRSVHNSHGRRSVSHGKSMDISPRMSARVSAGEYPSNLPLIDGTQPHPALPHTSRRGQKLKKRTNLQSSSATALL